MASAPVETKVKASTAASLAVGIVIAVLNAVSADSALLGPLPTWLQPLVLALAPAGVTLLAGYQARHTPRPDAGTAADVPRI